MTKVYKHVQGKILEPTIKDMTAAELEAKYTRINEEGYHCQTAARLDIANSAWWNGRAAGLLDAMMILDNTWAQLDEGTWRSKEGED